MQVQVPEQPGPETYLSLEVSPGRYWIKILGSRNGFLRQVLLGNVDVTDDPIDIRDDVSDVELTIVLASRLGQIDGTVVEDTGTPAIGVWGIAFSTNPARWSIPGTRYVAAKMAGVGGRFSLEGLPAGDYYVATLTEPDEMSLSYENGLDPADLEGLRAAAIVVSVSDGQTARTSIRLKPE
jgi:hypothetical protein